jgi:FixJ family two-component response regulator
LIVADHVERVQPRPLIGVVEPDADVRDFIQSLLMRAGYRCETFVSAERFERSALTTHFDCLITDSDLPGIDGLELARRVGGFKNPLPVMMLTSDVGADLQVAAHAARVLRVQKKPLGVREFLDLVAEVVHPPAP